MAVIAVVVTLYALGALFSALYGRTAAREREGELIPWHGRDLDWSGHRTAFYAAAMLCSMSGAVGGHQLIGLAPAWLVAAVCWAGPLTVGQAVHNRRVHRSRAVSAGRR